MSTKHQRNRREQALLTLLVGRGELVVVTGPTRSGKSALLHVVGLVDRPATGSYLLNGHDTGRLGERDRAALRGRYIGSQFQRSSLLPFASALDNVLLSLRYIDLPRRLRAPAALAALDRVGMADRAQAMTARLSFAERRLVSIARALAAGPSLLLFDDPTASLDQATAARIVAVLLGLGREGKTVLIATDDQVVAAYSARRVTLPGPTSAEPPPGDGASTRRPAAGSELGAHR